MKTYITKPKNIKISEIKENTSSLNPGDFRYLKFKNNNFYSIWKLSNYENVWEQVDVVNYLPFNTEYRLWTISWMKGVIYDEKSGWEYISPYLYKKSLKKLSKWEIIISRNATLWKASYINKEIKCILNWWLTNLFIKDKIKRFYTFWFSFSSILSEQLKLICSWWWTQQNAKRQDVLNIKIPFPSKNNNPEPEKVEELVGLIVQNLIDKEEQIKKKNILIDEKIEKELRENQKKEDKKYAFPRIGEIMEVGRLDTWMYEKNFKKIENLIKNYKKWFDFLNKKDLSWWNTPKRRFFEPSNKFFLWFTPTDINKWLLWEKKYIKSEKYNLWKDFALLFSNRSNCWECILYSPEYYFWWQHNQGIYRKTFKWKNLFENIFILVLFNSYLFQEMIWNIANWGTFDELRIEQYIKIKIPNFPNKKQEEIAKEYYNKSEKNSGLGLGDYLEEEKKRNEELWIFQLNMEIFELRDVLENLVDKIVRDEKINICFEY